MLKLILTLVQIIIGFYWAGDMARQNPKIDALVTHLEGGYGSFNEKLKSAKIVESLSVLRNFYGWVAVVAFLLFIVLSKIIGPNPNFLGYLSPVGIGSVFGWFSIKWCLEHRKTVREFGSQASLFVFGPILLGAFDLLLHTQFTQILAEGFYRIPLPLGWEVPHLTNPIAISGVISLLFATFFGLYYILTWLFTVPAAFASAVIILLPVLLARFIHAVAPRKPFVGFTFVLFTAVTLWSLWL
ncbi:hypothetical protein H3H37_11890 [Duganella sp. LX20W]|uniref:Uncharacterized protein n=1 Tax=Rugamonas brunnea TaxID=2758569 RepID=A0A7W2IC27_9BURK|nr:hypothetical protein [Rugamonas brunnea]MBA5637755.1 hypothetical protein [Rugamonas brunnea]